MGLALTAGNGVFLTADAVEGMHPWGPDQWHLSPGVDAAVREGKVFVLWLGHDGRSFQSLAFQQLMWNGIDWATASTARKA